MQRQERRASHEKEQYRSALHQNFQNCGRLEAWNPDHGPENLVIYAVTVLRQRMSYQWLFSSDWSKAFETGDGTSTPLQSGFDELALPFVRAMPPDVSDHAGTPPFASP